MHQGPDPRQDPPPDLRRTLVGQSERALAIEPLLLSPELDIVDGLLEAAGRPETRVIGVVDPDGHLVGILPIAELVTAVLGRLMPEAFLSDISDITQAAEFGHAVRARRVGEAMLPPISVRPEASVAEALHLMHERNLSGLYVVDIDGRPTGYLDLLELAASVMGQTRSGTSQGPSAIGAPGSASQPLGDPRHRPSS